ncbi:MAG: hypothetical protein HRT58_11960 [Crocinitomicaceae bacterium]|nr:hypothetical protein [Flavobacteriales bacterium]NQZ36375.1 hypothetical protein [Crocinitomicaceae bacterium]
MKKALFILFVTPLISFSQSSNDNQARYYMNRVKFHDGDNLLMDYSGFSNELSSKQCKENNIQKVIIERGRKEDKLTKTEYELTELGLIQRVIRAKDIESYSYEQDSLVSSIKSNGKKARTTHFNYLNGKVKKKEVYINDRLKTRILLDYGANEKVSFCLMQSGRNLKTSYAMSYEFVDDKLNRQEFVKNDRVLRIWDYSCEPKGELVDKKKLSTVCRVREENNDGSYTEHVRKVENGEVLLYTHHYDKDSMNYASSCERETGEKMWESTISKTERKYVNYSKNGSVKSKSRFKYNAEGKILESETTFGKNLKKVSKMINTYNENGLITSKTSFYKGKQSYIRKYSYV